MVRPREYKGNIAVEEHGWIPARTIVTCYQQEEQCTPRTGTQLIPKWASQISKLENGCRSGVSISRNEGHLRRIFVNYFVWIDLTEGVNRGEKIKK